MRKKITCIECPKGCQLDVDLDNGGHVIKVAGNQCPKGENYAKQELENPTRVLTTTVLAGRFRALILQGHKGHDMHWFFRSVLCGE